MKDSDPQTLLETLKTMVRANQVLIEGPQPPRQAADALGLRVVPVGHRLWTIQNAERPAYVQLTPWTYLTKIPRLNEFVVSANTFRFRQFRAERNRSLEETSLSDKSLEGWYPWQPQATSDREAR